ncbi:DNA topoisomerase family protein [Cognaticolwellia mytili]|uniref:DNA topoisomerase family protein n=1 Tax=Cognaticolwellia mytili TaxID=1888913 RepID=UPI000A16E5D0|nr:type I DNA topoisomerase [Cognaticolwellia mytili]
MSNPEKPLFSLHEHALEKSFEACPECSSKLMIKRGKSGAFFGCINYPNCKYTRPVVEHERVEEKVLAGSECPECGNELAVKQGRYGMFIGCTNFPECHHIEETHHHEDAGVICPKCQKADLIERTNRFGKIFYSCDDYPKCKYVVNYQPIQDVCPECHWSILVKRKMASGIVLMCPEKKCAYKRNDI